MKHAIRVLSREKAFSSFAVLTLALGIGAVTTIFSVLYGVLLKPLPYAEPERLYAVEEWASRFATEYPRIPVNAAHFASWLKQCSSCDIGALLQPTRFNLTGGGDPERVEGVSTTWQLFQVLGTQPQLGRTFTADDDRPGQNRQVVITDALWRRRFGADPTVIGRPIQLNGDSHVVVGVLRHDFRFPSSKQLGSVVALPNRADIFKPLALNWANQQVVGSFNYLVLMRLDQGASAARAEEEMTATLGDAGRLMTTELRAVLTPLHTRITGGSRDALWVLFGAVGALLLIVCVNLGHLLLVRAARRTRDVAVRLALGARTTDIVRSTLMESLVISVAGGSVGAALSVAGVRLLVALAPADVPRLEEIGVNIGSLAFALAVSMGCAVMCGLLPALRLIRTPASDALAAMSRRTIDAPGARRMRAWLVGTEVALSTVLLVVAGLLGASFFRVATIDRGFEVAQRLTVDVNLPGSRYPKSEQRDAFHRRMLESLNSLPGATAAGLVSSLPLKAQSWATLISREGDTRPMFERPIAHYRFVSPRYFEAMGIELIAGRFMTDADRGRPVAVVSVTAAQRGWQGENPIGRRLQNDRDEKIPLWAEVVGVVADVRTVHLEEAAPPIVYVPYWDGVMWQGNVWANATYVVRTTQDPVALTTALRQVVRSLDAELPLADLRTMEDVMAASIANRQFHTFLAGAFAVAALLLACLGTYGAISYTVTLRTNEMGLRVALGAAPTHIVRLVLRQGVAPAAVGLFVGVVAALWAGRFLSGMVFGVTPRDPATMATVAAAIAAATVTACWAPARRASRIDPATTLRHE